MKIQSAFAEIIESSLHSWLAQSWQWDVTPPFGSLVCIRQHQLISCGLVYQVNTGSMDPIRYPFPYKKTKQELIEQQPQIFEFLKTTFSCVPLGFFNKSSVEYRIPPVPPEIHSFVEIMPEDMSKQLLSKDAYLHVLFGASQNIANIDELLLALLKNQSELSLLTDAKLTHFFNTYSLLIGNDYRRLKLFTQRIESLKL